MLFQDTILKRSKITWKYTRARKRRHCGYPYLSRTTSSACELEVHELTIVICDNGDAKEQLQTRNVNERTTHASGLVPSKWSPDLFRPFRSRSTRIAAFLRADMHLRDIRWWCCVCVNVFLLNNMHVSVPATPACHGKAEPQVNTDFCRGLKGQKLWS